LFSPYYITANFFVKKIEAIGKMFNMKFIFKMRTKGYRKDIFEDIALIFLKTKTQILPFMECISVLIFPPIQII